MLWRTWLALRLLVGWIYTLGMSCLACLSLLVGRPVWGWLTLLKPWARGTLALLGVRVSVQGTENLRGPAIFVSNHQSIIDIIFMPAILPTKVRFVAKKELARVPFWGWIFAAAGGVMIDRKNPKAAIECI